MGNKTTDVDRAIGLAQENVIEDRDRLRKFCDTILDPEKTKELDAVGLSFLARNVAQLSDALTKSNAQLVEIAKIVLKREILSRDKHDDKGLSAKERAAIYEGIEIDDSVKN